MIATIALLLAASLGDSASKPLPLAAPAATAFRPAVANEDSTPRRRTKAVELSDAYYTRLRIHRIGSYTMLPLFAGEYWLGDKLIKGTSDQWVKPAHVGVALGLGALFTVNTVTGLWNLYESRDQSDGRTKKIVHTVLMLGADAGFAAAGAIGGNAQHSGSDAQLHKNVAIASMAASTAGTALMWFWKN